MEMSQLFWMFLFFVLTTLALLLFLREVNCWYWKINERIGHMLQIKATLEQLQHQMAMAGFAATASTLPPTAAASHPMCNACNKSVDADAKFCEYCGAAQTADRRGSDHETDL